MKRYRHYTKDKAIILSCFGSIIEQNKYENLKNIIQNEFSECDIFLSFGSRMVLKHLHKQGESYKNLPQTLADVDMAGYKNIIVASINLFPTDEHKVLQNTVKGFKLFSLANIRYTDAILTKTKYTTNFLQNLNKTISLANGDRIILKGTSSKFETELPQTDTDGNITTVKLLDNYKTVVYGLNLTHGQFVKYE
jgi:sirohydrochlorin cobaltochelatase